MASMQYRYARGQAGQSMPRPAWGSSAGGARASSPDPGNDGAAPLSNGGEAPKDRLASNQDEVILQLENELVELRNACAWKDQRIAELSRTDVSAGRLKRDIRLLALELHQTRKQLSDSQADLQELQGRGASEGGSTVPISTESSPVGADPNKSAAGNLRDSIAQLQEENRQLKESVARLQMAPAGHEAHHNRQQSGAATQRVAEQQLTGMQHSLPPGGYRSDPGAGVARAPYMAQTLPQPPQPTSSQPPAPSQLAPVPVPVPLPVPGQEEAVFQVVYSTTHLENTTTIGPTALQGIGTVDGVSSIAKVLLSRIHSSVCAAHRRPMNPAMPAAPVQPMQPGQIPMVMVPLQQNL